MNQARVSILIVAALIAAPSLSQAQKRKKPAPKPVPAAPAPEAPAAPSTEIDADAPPGAAGAPAAGAEPGVGEPGGPPEGGDIEAICKIDPSACPTVNLQEAAKKDMHEQMYAVQQIYALRYHRFEIQPAWNFTFNDQFVSHPGPVLGLNFYVTNVLAIGVGGGY